MHATRPLTARAVLGSCICWVADMPSFYWRRAYSAIIDCLFWKYLTNCTVWPCAATVMCQAAISSVINTCVCSVALSHKTPWHALTLRPPHPWSIHLYAAPHDVHCPLGLRCVDWWIHTHMIVTLWCTICTGTLQSVAWSRGKRAGYCRGTIHAWRACICMKQAWLNIWLLESEICPPNMSMKQ